ncbi:MAG: IclR family transcriptional regulator [Lachnospiraceae bacterium]|nr:IclR family transcriptional regulator [Lachnospiraceae bacterium]
MENTTNNPIQSADRIFSILEALADRGSMRIIDLSELLGLHKSTVHRQLASLVSMGYVIHNEQSGEYSLTFKLVELSGKILKNMDILNLVRPYAEKLSEKCDETVHFVKRSGEVVLYLDKVEAQSVKMRSVRLSSQIGLSRPMYCSGVGKAIMAQLSDQEVTEIWNNSTIEKKTEKTITDLKTLKKELKETLKRGYALDNEENELGIRCIAVPVYDYRNQPIYAMSISTLVGRMPDDRLEELAKLLKETVANISRVLGSTKL